MEPKKIYKYTNKHRIEWSIIKMCKGKYQVSAGSYLGILSGPSLQAIKALLKDIKVPR